MRVQLAPPTVSCYKERESFPLRALAACLTRCSLPIQSHHCDAVWHEAPNSVLLLQQQKTNTLGDQDK